MALLVLVVTARPNVSRDVQQALAANTPVVALESTIVAHGFPFPENAVVAQALHQAVADSGAVPAMIAIVEGEVRVGLDDEAIEFVTRSDDVEKCGVADIAAVCARGANGATTVSASITLAAHAGISVFATGGLGGVHRSLQVGGAQPMDVSADLLALSRTPITVVSSGAKMLLDLPATVEALESLGVPLLGYRTRDFPAFYASSSGIPLRHTFDDVSTLALAIRHQRAMGANAGVLVCNPPPDDVALHPGELGRWVDQALAEASEERVTGADITPYVLDALHRLSGGGTITCNKALAKSNAALAGRLAHALAIQEGE
jgi:pseudouridine-5'-phosphate glycosidase